MIKVVFRKPYSPEVTKAEVLDFNYKWKYYDKNGVLKTDSLNQDELVNSCDYITPDEFVSNGILGDVNDGFYGDVSDIPSDYSGLLAYMENLKLVIEKAQADISGKIGEDKPEVGKAGKEVEEPKGEE